MAGRGVGVTDLATGAGVADVRVRERVVAGENSGAAVAEQYVLPAKERVVGTVITFATFRIPARAVTLQPLLSILNPSGSTIVVALRNLIVSYETIVAKTVINPYARLWRTTTTITGGSSITVAAGTVLKARTADSNGVATVLQDASADGTLAGTALGVTPAGSNPIAGRFLGRMHTLAGISPASGGGRLDLLAGIPDDEPLELRANEALAVRIEAAAALAAADFHYLIDVAYEEFTRP